MRWKRRPDGSNWGEFGTDDQIGRMNLLTPESRRRSDLDPWDARNLRTLRRLLPPGRSL